MNRFRNPLVIGVACLALAAIPATGWADIAACEKNFAVKDGFFDKKIYRTWQDLRDLSQMMIYRRAYEYLLKDGWVINRMDKEYWAISASQAEELSGGEGKAANLNILIENAGNYFGGIPSRKGTLGAYRITITFSVPGGLHTDEGMIKKYLCATLAEIKEGTYVAK